MAITNMLDNQISFTPKVLPDWFMKTLLKPSFITKDYIRVEGNVTKDAVLRKLVMNNNSISTVDDRDCAWEPVERFTATNETKTLKNWKVNMEQCLDELDSIYSENVLEQFRSYQAGANKTEMPNDLEDGIRFYVQNALASDIERIIIGGESNAVDGVHSGLLDQLAASTTAIKVNNAVQINASNVLTEIQRVYDAIPNVVLNEGLAEPDKAPVRIFVDINTYRYAKQALSTPYNDNVVVLPSWTYDNGVIRYMGVEIALVPYMPANTMFAASRDNMIFFTDLLSDTTEIRMERGKELTNENIVYIKSKYRALASFVYEDEVVLYKL